MGFYGYNPAQYVQQDRTGIGAASQIAATSIAQIPQNIRAKEKHELEKERFELDKKAIEAAKNNWRDMETAATVARKQYRAKATEAVKNGLMTEEELATNIQKFPMPTGLDKKDPAAYIKKFRETNITLLEDLQTRQRSGQVSQIGQQAQQPTPTQFTPGLQGATETPVSEQIASRSFESASPGAIQTPSQPAPADIEGFTKKMGQIATEQGVDLTKEQIAVEQEKSGLQTRQQEATQQRQVAKDAASKTQQEFDNDLATKRNTRQEAELRIKETKGKEIKPITMNEVSGILQFNVKEINADIKSVDQAMKLNDDLDEPNRDIADQLKVKRKALEAEHDKAMKTLLNLVKIDVAAEAPPAGGEPQDVTKARQAIAVAKDLLEKSDFSQYTQEQLNLIIQNAQNIIGQ